MTSTNSSHCVRAFLKGAGGYGEEEILWISSRLGDKGEVISWYLWFLTFGTCDIRKWNPLLLLFLSDLISMLAHREPPAWLIVHRVATHQSGCYMKCLPCITAGGIVDWACSFWMTKTDVLTPPRSPSKAGLALSTAVKFAALGYYNVATHKARLMNIRHFGTRRAPARQGGN